MTEATANPFPSRGQAGADPHSIPLDRIHVADAELFETDTLWGYFERLRNEAVTLGLPATILVDDEGCELAVLQGPAHWNTPDGHRVIETLLEV